LNRRSPAFTFTEVIVTVAILAGSTLAFTHLIDTGIQSVRRSGENTRSLFICKSVMEELKTIPMDQLYAYNNKKFDNGKGNIKIQFTDQNRAEITVKHKIELKTMRVKL
jgi:hypothetical protein